MEYILLGIGLAVGGISGFFINSKLKPQESTTPVVITESKVSEKLADVDLVEIPCSSKFVKDHGDLLCRELFCRMQQRGIDSKTSTVDCSGISNMNNTLKFIEVLEKNCKLDQEDTDKYNKCFDRYNRILTTSKSGQ